MNFVQELKILVYVMLGSIPFDALIQRKDCSEDELRVYPVRKETDTSELEVFITLFGRELTKMYLS